MVSYQQRLFFDNESGQKVLYPGVQASLLRLEVKGACKVYGKLFGQSDPIQLAGISATTYAPTNDFQNALYSIEVSGMQEILIVSNQKSTISVKFVY